MCYKEPTKSNKVHNKKVNKCTGECAGKCVGICLNKRPNYNFSNDINEDNNVINQEHKKHNVADIIKTHQEHTNIMKKNKAKMPNIVKKSSNKLIINDSIPHYQKHSSNIIKKDKVKKDTSKVSSIKSKKNNNDIITKSGSKKGISQKKNSKKINDKSFDKKIYKNSIKINNSRKNTNTNKLSYLSSSDHELTDKNNSSQKLKSNDSSDLNSIKTADILMLS